MEEFLIILCEATIAEDLGMYDHALNRLGMALRIVKENGGLIRQMQLEKWIDRVTEHTTQPRKRIKKS